MSPSRVGAAAPNGAEVVAEARSEPSGCPFHGGDAASASPPPEPNASGCPVHRVGGNPNRTKADLIARRVLRISDAPAVGSTKAAYGAFQRSMLISALRCTLTYVVFPLVLPALNFAHGFGPALGLVIGVVAIVCDVFAVRRFFVLDHSWRWRFAIVAGGVVSLLAFLLVRDIAQLVS